MPRKPVKKPLKIVSIWTKIAAYKETIGLVIFMVTTCISGFSYIANYFATQDQLKISNCISNRQVKLLDLTMRVWMDNEGITQLQTEQSKLEAKSDKDKTLDDRDKLKQLQNLIDQHQKDLTDATTARTFYENKECGTLGKLSDNE